MRRSPLVLVFTLAACGPDAIDASTSSGAETSSTDTPTDTGSSETSGDPTSPPDTGDPLLDLPEGPCDPWQQDCPDGSKCVPVAENGNFNTSRCVPIGGDQAPGESCVYGGPSEGTDDCDATGYCWNSVEVDGVLVGECLAFCTGTVDTPMCPEGSFCSVSAEGSVNLCLPICDPLAQDCDEGFGCYWANFEFTCIVTGGPGLGTGDACGYINDCSAGGLCVDASLIPDCMGASCCTDWCDLGLGDAGCAALPGTSCVAFFEEGAAPEGSEDVGVCIIPR